MTLDYAMLHFTGHSRKRMSQRGLSLNDVEYVVRNGTRYRKAGVIHCFLRRKDIPADDRRDDSLRRLEGTTVLLDARHGQEVITTYRNRNALSKIRAKPKYRIPRR
jgi:hypothetical protein